MHIYTEVNKDTTTKNFTTKTTTSEYLIFHRGITALHFCAFRIHGQIWEGRLGCKYVVLLTIAVVYFKDCHIITITKTASDLNRLKRYIIRFVFSSQLSTRRYSSRSADSSEFWKSKEMPATSSNSDIPEHRWSLISLLGGTWRMVVCGSAGRKESITLRCIHGGDELQFDVWSLTYPRTANSNLIVVNIKIIYNLNDCLCIFVKS